MNENDLKRKVPMREPMTIPESKQYVMNLTKRGFDYGRWDREKDQQELIETCDPRNYD